ncbi:AraC family transcriptional regulator [Vibrio navarrensis]|uniref:AraC family transcriptional regulator n=1 Tax=Vibrio navarrensis TaxID=29495 RepID=UPI00186A4FC3|nr:AraC family transcriptional regulator N-terminal domain-containing protein [Vibrio navarrensis]MBE4591112.1 AraC family transcriptional regulator [Vibrio navarrensis]
METLAKIMQRYVECRGLSALEGITKTPIPGVWFYRSSRGNSRQPFVYQSGIIVLGQGCKNIHIGDTPVCYGPNDYLVVGVPMPLECEAFASEHQPLLGISVDIPLPLLQKMVHKLESLNYRTGVPVSQEACGLKSVKMDDRMLDVCKRLMRALCDDVESEMLGESLLEEIVFRALLSQEGYVLFELAQKEGFYSKIARVLEKVHQDYPNAMTVQGLAAEANMSVSAFHNAFRSVTLESPIQYIKKVRLNKARELIKLEGRRVNDAARMVGYTSTSQFSREYKRHFNETPSGSATA